MVPEYLVFLEDQLDLLCHSDLVCLALLEDRLNHSDLGFLVAPVNQLDRSLPLLLAHLVCLVSLEGRLDRLAPVPLALLVDQSDRLLLPVPGFLVDLADQSDRLLLVSLVDLECLDHPLDPLPPSVPVLLANLLHQLLRSVPGFLVPLEFQSLLLLRSLLLPLLLQSDQLDPLVILLDRLDQLDLLVDQLDRLLQSGQLQNLSDQLSQWLLLGRLDLDHLVNRLDQSDRLHLALLVFLVFLLDLPAPFLPGDLVNLEHQFPLVDPLVLAPLEFLENQLDRLDQSDPVFLVFRLHLVNHYLLNYLAHLVYQYFQLVQSDQFPLALLVCLVFLLGRLDRFLLAFLVCLVFLLDRSDRLGQEFLVSLEYQLDQSDLFLLVFLEHLVFPVGLVLP